MFSLEGAVTWRLQKSRPRALNLAGYGATALALPPSRAAQQLAPVHRASVSARLPSPVLFCDARAVPSVAAHPWNIRSHTRRRPRPKAL